MEVLAIAKQNNEVQINEQITFQNVMVIGPNGEKMGVKNINDALTLSKYAGLDLVLLNNDPKNPVCKIITISFVMRNKKEKKKLRRNKENKILKLKNIDLVFQ